jgi:hypothetical protein
MITTTLNRIKACNPGAPFWDALLQDLGKTCSDDAPLSYAQILRSCGLEGATWAIRAEPRYDGLWQVFAIECARIVQNLVRDPGEARALDVAERYLRSLTARDHLFSALQKALDALAHATRHVDEAADQMTWKRAMIAARASASICCALTAVTASVVPDAGPTDLYDAVEAAVFAAGDAGDIAGQGDVREIQYNLFMRLVSQSAPRSIH